MYLFYSVLRPSTRIVNKICYDFIVNWIHFCNVSACGLIDASHFHNCTQMNGTWYNHTCHTTNTASAEELAVYQNLTAGMSLKDHMETRFSPSDEYFQ